MGKWHWGDRHLNSAAQALLWHEVIPVRLSWVVSSDPQLPYLRQLTVEWDRERGRERKTASLRIESELSIKARKEQREERYKVGGKAIPGRETKRSQEREVSRRIEQCKESPEGTTSEDWMFCFCIQPFQMWVIPPLGRLIACWYNITAFISLKTNTSDELWLCVLHVFFFFSSFFFFFLSFFTLFHPPSAAQELLTSCNLNIHKSGRKILGSVPISIKHNDTF